MDRPRPPSFRLCTGAPRSDERLLAVAHEPAEGDHVRDATGRRVRLGRRLGAGGEGVVHVTDAGLVCKLYAPPRRTVGARQKLELMVRVSVNHPGICWPRSLAFTEAGEFVGFLMDQARGKELQRSVFVKPLLVQTFPAWTRRHLVALAITILTAIHALHRRNILVGDLSPLNILVADEHHVFLVDTDSFQVEDYPCPVGTATFLAPELAGRDLRSVLRSFADERFALATLVFMLLVPGKPPYSHAGGGDPAANVRQRHFPYALRERRGQGVPAGPWRFIWSHLPLYLKEAFHAVFADGARPTVEEWLALMRRYELDLGRGHLSSAIFPTGFKPLRQEEVLRKGGEWVRCTECGTGFGRFEPGLDLCPDCRGREVQVRCGLCGRDFAVSRGAARGLAGREPLCPACRSVTSTVTCKECGRSFTLTAADRAFYKRKGLQLPRRCATCRRQRRTPFLMSGPTTVSPAP